MKANVPGVFCFSTRKAYAKRYGLPDPDEMNMSEIDFDDQVSQNNYTAAFSFGMNLWRSCYYYFPFHFQTYLLKRLI